MFKFTNKLHLLRDELRSTIISCEAAEMLVVSPVKSVQSAQAIEDIDVCGVSSSSCKQDFDMFEIPGDVMSQASQAPSSTSTDIMSEFDWKMSLFIASEQSLIVRDFPDSPIKPVNQHVADWKQSFDDNEHVLNTELGFEYCMRLIMDVAQPFALCDLLNTQDMMNEQATKVIDIKRTSANFTFLPIISSIHLTSWLVVIDWENKNWLIVDPSNRLNDEKEFASLVVRVLKDNCKALRQFTGGPIKISSWFHQSYPRIHIAFATWFICRLFKYTLKLPSNIIYTELEFRRFTKFILGEIRLKFGEITGDSTHGIADVRFDVASLLDNECIFCHRRGFKNLGRHISMAHEGQAKHAVNTRITKLGQQARKQM